MSGRKLHPRQEEILAVLEKGVEGLSLRDIAAEIGVRSPNTVLHHLRRLEKQGYLRRHPSDSGRWLTLADPARDLVHVNLYGAAQCGPGGFFGDDNVEERVPLSTRLFGVDENVFLVRARGDSMEPYVCERDLVLARRQHQVESGDMAVVVHEGRPKVKKVIRAGERVVLASLNPRYAPVDVSPDDDFRIAGRVRGIIRFVG